MTGEYLTIKEVSEAWGISARRVQILCTEGRIQGAFKRGRTWLIPKTVARPDDRRVKSSEVNEKYFSTELHEKDLEFLFSFLHEMRQNVSSILGFSELATSRIKDPAAALSYINNISTSGSELLEMANNFMTIIQVERGEIEPEYKVNHISESVDAAFAQLLSKAHDNSIIVRCNKEITHEYVYIDDILWKNVIENIINFVIKNTQRGGSAKIGLTEVDLDGPDRCIFRISIDIAGGTVGKDFAKFQRTDTLFLAIKRVIEFLGGHFITASDNYRSDNLSYSSSDIKLAFEAPFKIAPSEVAEASEDGEVDGDKYKGMRVLVAEDNVLNRTAAQMILEDAGFVVETAEDGIFAVAMVERALPNYYDLILMDLQMPNVNGVTATKLIRALRDSSKASIPVFAMTANVSEKDKKDALAAGMNGFLEKPIDLNKLYKLLDVIK
ncbi:MAG: response regulator [Saccharofermentans sp.]|nr:response regulator [Saccharofermentans sp.]